MMGACPRVVLTHHRMVVFLWGEQCAYFFRKSLMYRAVASSCYYCSCTVVDSGGSSGGWAKKSSRSRPLRDGDEESSALFLPVTGSIPSSHINESFNPAQNQFQLAERGSDSISHFVQHQKRKRGLCTLTQHNQQLHYPVKCFPPQLTSRMTSSWVSSPWNWRVSLMTKKGKWWCVLQPKREGDGFRESSDHQRDRNNSTAGFRFWAGCCQHSLLHEETELAFQGRWQIEGTQNQHTSSSLDEPGFG